MNGKNKNLCSPFLYRSSGLRLLVATITMPLSKSSVNSRFNIIAFAMSVTWQEFMIVLQIKRFTHMVTSKLLKTFKVYLKLLEIHQNTVATIVLELCPLPLVWNRNFLWRSILICALDHGRLT